MATVHEYNNPGAPSATVSESRSGSLRSRLAGGPAIQKIFLAVERHGVANTFYDLTLKAANRVVFFKVYRGVSVERPEPEFLRCPGRYTPMFLSESMIRQLATNPENDMSQSFVEEALARGDECYGILHGDILAAYGWYSRKPTVLEPDLLLHFNDDYVYMYKGFTPPRYRGERLHAIGMTLALQDYLARGFRGLVSIVESNNFNSLKSVVRMGYAQVGSVYAVRILGRYVTHGTKGCEKLGLYVEQVSGRFIASPDSKTASISK